MNKDLILDAMGHIDPALVEAADRTPVKARRGGWIKAAGIAACLCLVLAGTAVAWNSSRVRISWVDETSEDWLKENDVVYTIEHDYAYFPLDCFSDEVTEPAEDAEYGLVGWAFQSHAELEDFLGFALWNNPVLDAAARGPKSSTPKMKDKPTHILLTAFYNGKGPTSISTDENYVIDGVWVSAEADVYTNLMQEDVETYAEYHGKPGPGIMTGGDGIEVSMEEDYSTLSGVEAALTKRVSSAWGPEHTEFWAHFDVNGIRFRVDARPDLTGTFLSEFEDDPAHTLEVLKKVLDGFVFEP